MKCSPKRFSFSDSVQWQSGVSYFQRTSDARKRRYWCKEAKEEQEVWLGLALFVFIGCKIVHRRSFYPVVNVCQKKCKNPFHVSERRVLRSSLLVTICGEPRIAQPDIFLGERVNKSLLRRILETAKQGNPYTQQSDKTEITSSVRMQKRDGRVQYPFC